MGTEDVLRNVVVYFERCVNTVNKTLRPYLITTLRYRIMTLHHCIVTLSLSLLYYSLWFGIKVIRVNCHMSKLYANFVPFENCIKMGKKIMNILETKVDFSLIGFCFLKEVSNFCVMLTDMGNLFLACFSSSFISVVVCVDLHRVMCSHVFTETLCKQSKQPIVYTSYGWVVYSCLISVSNVFKSAV